MLHTKCPINIFWDTVYRNILGKTALGSSSSFQKTLLPSVFVPLNTKRNNFRGFQGLVLFTINDLIKQIH